MASSDGEEESDEGTGSWRRRAAVAIVVVVAILVGAVALGLLGVPRVESVENRFAGVNETTTVIRTDLTVANPNPVGVQLGGVTVNYTVGLNGIWPTGRNMGSGSARTGRRSRFAPRWTTSGYRRGG